MKNRIVKRSVYFAGDFASNTGPAIVNKSYLPYMKDLSFICIYNNKAIRVIHFVSRLIYTKSILVSSLSRYHLALIRIGNFLGMPTFYLMHGYVKLESKINKDIDAAPKSSASTARGDNSLSSKGSARDTLVSTLIPTYRGKGNLIRAIESVLQQTHKNIEVIVVDDNRPGSLHRRGTEKLMLKYAGDTRVKYVKHKKNRNGAAARNTAFTKSSGDFICILDDDDCFAANKLEEQLAYLLNHPQHMAASCPVRRHGKVIEIEDKDNFTDDILTLKATPHTSSLMLRREAYKALGGFNVEYKRHQDYEFLLRFFRQFKLAIVKTTSVDLSSAGSDNRLKAEELEAVKTKFLSEFEYIIREHKNSKKFKRQVYAANYAQLFFAYMKTGDYKNTLRISAWTIGKTGRFFVQDVAIYAFRYMNWGSRV